MPGFAASSSSAPVSPASRASELALPSRISSAPAASSLPGFVPIPPSPPLVGPHIGPCIDRQPLGLEWLSFIFNQQILVILSSGDHYQSGYNVMLLNAQTDPKIVCLLKFGGILEA